MIFIITVFIVVLLISITTYLYARRRDRQRDVYGDELKDLRRWLHAYYVSFLDVAHPPIDPKTGERPPSQPYRELLASMAYPSDIIAYAQRQLYADWPYKLQMEWDGWLFAHLNELLPYIKGMVVDYQNQTATMTDDLITEGTDCLRSALHELAKQMFDADIDDHNTFSLLHATEVYQSQENMR